MQLNYLLFSPVPVPGPDLVGGLGIVLFPQHLHQFPIALLDFVASAQASAGLHHHEVRVLHVGMALLVGAVKCE